MAPMSAKPRMVARGDRLVTFSFVVLIVPLVLAFLVFSHKDDQRQWPTAAAHVSETRIVAVAAEEHAFQAGSILYRVEAHVTYELKGKHVERWVPASGTKRDRAYLESWLSQKKRDSCFVRWNPKNPDDVEAVLIDNVSQNVSH